METGNAKDMEMTLIQNDHYINSDTSKTDPIKAAESERHDMIHKRFMIIKYIIFLVVGISYLIYGSIKYSNAKTHPLTKTYEETIDAYPLPTTMACVTNNYTLDLSMRSYFDLVHIVYFDTAGIYHEIQGDCVWYGNNTGYTQDLINSATDHCIILDDRNEVYNEDCYMIIPPKIVTNATSYWIRYMYWDKDYLQPDPVIYERTGIATPWFLADELR